MKKFYLLLVCAVVLMMPKAKAQFNIQEMYDFGRGHFTTTFEFFNGDKFGNTFIFTDIYHPFTLHVPVGYYTEVSRSLNFWNDSKLRDFSIQLQWNGGQFASNAWLIGVQYCFHDADFSNMLTIELMYKNIRQHKSSISSVFPIQLTAVWGCNDLFGVKGLVFSGFLDLWWEDIYGSPTKFNDVVLLAEPQIWYNIGQYFNCKHLYAGGEVELAYNFGGARFSEAEFYKNEKFTVAPCLGLKWVF